MKKFVICAIMLMGSISNVNAETYQKRNYSYTNSTAQGVAEIQANRGSMGHCGGNRGYEGVGFSSRSADEAIKNCCYWGQKTPIEIGVARGRNGWYACVRYR